MVIYARTNEIFRFYTFAYNNEATILFDANKLRVQFASKVRFCIRIVQSRSLAHMFAYAKETPVILSRWIIH